MNPFLNLIQKSLTVKLFPSSMLFYLGSNFGKKEEIRDEE